MILKKEMEDIIRIVVIWVMELSEKDRNFSAAGSSN